jgi:hypothetical protein
MTGAEQIYSVYPRKIAKRAALVSIEKAIRRLEYGEAGEPLTRAVATTRLFCAVIQYAQTPAGTSGQFTPYPTTWFNQSRYLDDTQEWYRNDESKHESLARRNRDALDEVFGKLPRPDRSPILAQPSDRGNKKLAGFTRNLFLEGD